MNVTIEKSLARGRVAAPPSKSMAHRYLIAGALSGGSTVRGVSGSEDMNATLDCLTALGATVTRQGDTVTIGGAVPRQGASRPLGCRESGSTLRFMIPLCLLGETPVTLTGSRRLMQRSLAVYEELCAARGLTCHPDSDRVTVCGPLPAGIYRVRGDISSQFISGLMLALPLLDGDSEVDITGTLESAAYLDMTARAMADFGVTVIRPDARHIRLPGGQRYAPRALTVEGDYSNAAFLEALHYLGGQVTVTGLPEDTAQGDAVYRQWFPRLAAGCPTLDIADCPDLGPVLMALAAAHHGVRLTGTRRLRIKESDRGSAMAEELRKMGIRCRVEENEIAVEPGTLHAPSRPLDGHNDHRIVMAMSLLCTRTGGTITGAEAVNKSFPDYFTRLASLGVAVREDTP